jgi:hypothetical protein
VGSDSNTPIKWMEYLVEQMPPIGSGRSDTFRLHVVVLT